ncbi:uncharacterized protein LACBIDRAFT_303382 [Laccaria bicolor S238N-H82]|uniref:Predicted protein n=1 Tax=Laccaria bicolor (strain S238N-H82 / ATCC MYA-4686) TaxID=486041 RepID=B0DJB9_LACBS|nr:uncharacterized protein LACBIDRAFT_303330 [Laccaria bicolor S238N-H82]XP_001884070.1 uncharacterized protein LACBIDRAFT_303382 [Laccaria bicolor S238N-H82]EDR05377.1 predicted protein [Laccaria bicolor S238N-H82]EDR05512.1 predicted protein [Laccaria bicolor S238N-H82]|eukprot:XP_001883935.1 predicted protein [Laccaria bicolor S238N-H82]
MSAFVTQTQAAYTLPVNVSIIGYHWRTSQEHCFSDLYAPYHHPLGLDSRTPGIGARLRSLRRCAENDVWQE